MSTYYERNKEKIKENRRKRYEEKQKQNVISMNTTPQSTRYLGSQHAGTTPQPTRHLAGAYASETPQSTRHHMEKSTLFLFVLGLFSVFLIWQGAQFFMKQGYSQEEAYVCSVFGELLLIVSSGLVFYGETKRTKQVFMFICSLSIFLLGAFLHNGVKKSLLDASPEYQRTKSEYALIKNNIEDLKRDKLNQPESYKTKKLEIQNTIDKKMISLGAHSSMLRAFESKSMGLGDYYIAWIRIALMVLNAYLVHAFLKEFSLRLGGPSYD